MTHDSKCFMTRKAISSGTSCIQRGLADLLFILQIRSSHLPTHLSDSWWLTHSQWGAVIWLKTGSLVMLGRLLVYTSFCSINTPPYSPSFKLSI
jgi:hypothetical protein